MLNRQRALEIKELEEHRSIWFDIMRALVEKTAG